MPKPVREAVRTTCPYCGVGCGVRASLNKDESWTIDGDPDHPSNFGRLCSKGSALGETLGLEGRLLYPEVDGERASWKTALETTANRLGAIIERHGPDSVAFYLSGQLLTEDYYVANKLMKGFIGSANVDTNSRLCMASSVAGHKRAFGADAVPACYEDLDAADLVVLVGSNAAWCHPVLFRRMMTNKETRGARIVTVDTRATVTGAAADLALTIAPGSDAVLFNGLLVHLAEAGAFDTAFIDSHCEGLEKTVSAARADAPTPETVARKCRLPIADVHRFYDLFARTARTVTCYSQGVNQSATGTDKVNAILNCHLATGRIGKAGAGPLSLTGQPNAMGGREVGGLANQLAAHMGFDDPADIERVAWFWHAPRIAGKEGLKAVDLFRAVTDGRIKAVWIMATNPAVSLPDASAVKAGLEKCELVIVSDCVAATDTLAYAHIKLPAAAWGEKDGSVTNSERRISRQRAFLPPPGDAKPDWWIVSQVAKWLGFKNAFDYGSAADVFREHAALSAFENDGRRAFDIGALAALSNAEYDALAPVQWPARAAPGPHSPAPETGARNPARLFETGGFFTPSGRARFVPVTACAPVHAVSDAYPLALNTGRVRDQWHTMTRTGKSPTLSRHCPEPTVAIHPADAARFGIEDTAPARLETAWGAAVVRAHVTAEQPAGTVFVPIHWSHETSLSGGVGPLVNPATDPISGQPESKHTPVWIRAVKTAYRGFCLTRAPLDLSASVYWAVTREHACLSYLLALKSQDGCTLTRCLTRWASDTFRCAPNDLIEYKDTALGLYRAALITRGRLDACVFLSATEALPTFQGLAALFGQSALDAASRKALLSGAADTGQADPGRIVCSCFAVGVNRLNEAIARRSLKSTEDVGALLQAGTNCGSCLPEIRALLADA